MAGSSSEENHSRLYSHSQARAQSIRNGLLEDEVKTMQRVSPTRHHDIIAEAGPPHSVYVELELEILTAQLPPSAPLASRRGAGGWIFQCGLCRRATLPVCGR
jgi:hypothetical protein